MVSPSPPGEAIRRARAYQTKKAKWGKLNRQLAAAMAVVLLAGLVSCGNDGTSKPEESVATGASAPASKKPFITVPSVEGKSFADAQSAIKSAGFSVTVAVGPDGKAWSTLVPGADVSAVSTIPAAGTATDVDNVQIHVNRSQTEQQTIANAATAAAKLAARYEFKCTGSSGTGSGSSALKGFRDVWASPSYTNGSSCTLNIDGKPFYEANALLPSEQTVVDAVAQHGGDARIPITAFAIVYGLCAKVDADYPDRVMADMASKRAQAQAALSLCPDAPHAAALNNVVTVARVGDGAKVVGKDMEPGTYRTKPGIKDCYWSRNTGGGDIIENDFVGFAPDGVTVSVYPGEGFESQRCEPWIKIG